MHDKFAVELLEKFLKNNNLDLKIIASYNDEVSQAANAFLNRLMVDNNLSIKIGVSWKQLPPTRNEKISGETVKKEEQKIKGE